MAKTKRIATPTEAPSAPEVEAQQDEAVTEVATPTEAPSAELRDLAVAPPPTGRVLVRNVSGARCNGVEPGKTGLIDARIMALGALELELVD